MPPDFAAAASAIVPILFFLGAYYYAVWDSRQKDSAADEQIAIKVVLFSLILAALSIVVGGVGTLLHYGLSGAKTGTPAIKEGAAALISGGGILFFLAKMLLPRTNYTEKPSVFNMFVGVVSLIFGLTALIGFSNFVTSIIGGGGAWIRYSELLTSFLTHGAVAFVAINRLGAINGWKMPVRPVRPAGGYPPQGGGGVPQGYPPQQSGGMPQQGYPPQQQGYPPQQQGYPPQGGMPPQGGGGYPPQGGGGYPPR